MTARYGVIGAGRMGALRARQLLAHPEVGSVVIADAQPGRAEALARTLGCAAATVDDLFGGDADGDRDLDPDPGPGRDPDLDLGGIGVAASTDAHAELVERCVRAGVACRCEKPLTHDLASTRRLMRLSAGQAAFVQVGFQRRFDAECRRLHAAMRDGSLGTVRRMHLISADSSPPAPDFVAGSGGLFVDLLIHDFDLVRWRTGAEVTEVYAIGSADGDPLLAEAGDVHNAACVLRLSNGVVATVHGARDNGAGHDVRIEVAGTRRTLAAGLGARTPLRSVSPGAAFPDG
jgi:myo-inositol 2-dehydrogenase/D-chiro-inositol 1-dehydrogenase